jgi:hypothetical protein
MLESELRDSDYSLFSKWKGGHQVETNRASHYELKFFRREMWRVIDDRMEEVKFARSLDRQPPRYYEFRARKRVIQLSIIVVLEKLPD